MNSTQSQTVYVVDEQTAIDILLVQSAEQCACGDSLITDRDRLRGERAAAARTDSESDDGTWIALRAHALAAPLASQHVVFTYASSLKGWPKRAALALITAGAVAGFAVSLTDSGTTINLLAPPVWCLIIWNLFVIVAHFSRANVVAHAQPMLTKIALKLRMPDRVNAAGPDAQIALQAYRDFLLRWFGATAPLQRARLSTLLHIAAISAAVAIIAGMYVRGLVLGYDVSWSSTFMTSESVHNILHAVLYPASIVSGQSIPNAAILEAIHQGTATAQERSAAVWIHLWATTVATLVIVPRCAFAVIGAQAAHRLRNRIELDISQAYFRRLGRVHRNRQHSITVFPAYQNPDATSEATLRNLLALAAPDAKTIQTDTALDETTEVPESRPGSEDELWILLVALGTTPEEEVHGRWLDRLREQRPAGLVLILDEQDFARRFGPDSTRLKQRLAAWKELAERHQTSICVLNLQHPSTDGAVDRLAAAIDAEL